MAKKRTTQVEKALEIAGAEIRLAEARITALHFSMDKLRQKARMNGDARKEFSALHAVLFDDLNDCYRTFFMWSGLVGGEAVREANKRALKHYLSKKSSIMGYLGFDGSYKCADEVIFREELDSLATEQ